MKISKFRVFSGFFTIIFLITAVNSAAAKEGLISGSFFRETGIANWLKAAYFFGVGIIGVLAVAVLIFAGIQYMTSMGSPEAITQAKTKIAAGIAGLLIILLSYTILHTLDPRLVKLGFEIEKVELPEKATTFAIEPPSVKKEITAENPDAAQRDCIQQCGGADKVLKVEKGEGEKKWVCECKGSTTQK